MKTAKLSLLIIVASILNLSAFAQVVITPSNPDDNSNLVCSIGGLNPSGYTYAWVVDGQSRNFANLVPASETSINQKWTCKISSAPTMYTGAISIGEASVVIAAPVITPPTVTNQAPVADFTSNSPQNEGSTVTFTSNSYDPDGTIASYSWNFGDGSTSALKNPTHVYTNNGTYSVRLTVTDNSDSVNALTKAIIVNDLTPTANFTLFPTTVAVNQTAHFSGIANSYDSIVSWKWLFEGTLNVGSQNETYRFRMPGTYNVSLLVTDIDGSSYQVGPKQVQVVLPNIYGTIYNIDNGSVIPGANISFYDNSVCDLDEITLNGTCSNVKLVPKSIPDTVSDANGNYAFYLPSGVYHMVIQHSQQDDLNIFVNDTPKKHDAELNERLNAQDYNFEGHILYSGRYENGNKYVVGDPLDFVMFGVTRPGSAPVNATYTVERHIEELGDGGSDGALVLNGSLSNANQTLNVPGDGTKVGDTFHFIIPPELSAPGRYDIHVLVNNSGTLEKWHKIGNFFIDNITTTVADNVTEIINNTAVVLNNVTVTTRYSPELNLVKGPNYWDFANDTLNIGQYKDQQFNSSFQVKIDAQPNTILSHLLIASQLSNVSEACTFGPEGDEVTISAPGALINISTYSGYDQLVLNVTNARDPTGCYVYPSFLYNVSDKYMINMQAKERYYGAFSSTRSINATIWATEQQMRNIWYDITEYSLPGVRNLSKPVGFSGYYNGDHCGGNGGYCLDSTEDNAGIPINITDISRHYYGLPDYWDIANGGVGFEYRSAEEGYDVGGVSWATGSPFTAYSCWDSSADGLGATNCERDAMKNLWMTPPTTYKFLVVDPMTANNGRDTIISFLTQVCSDISGCTP